MAIEFEVERPEDFEKLIHDKDIRITKALTNTILKNTAGEVSVKSGECLSGNRMPLNLSL